jgi:hypothetical protein
MHGLNEPRRISMWLASGLRRRTVQQAATPRSRGGLGVRHPVPRAPSRAVAGSARPRRALPGTRRGACPPRTRAALRLGPAARPSGPPSAALRSGPRAPPSAVPRVLACMGEPAPHVSLWVAEPTVATDIAARARAHLGHGRPVTQRQDQSTMRAGPLSRWVVFDPRLQVTGDPGQT